MARMLHTSTPRGPHGGWLDEFSALGDPMFLSLHTGTIQSLTASPVHGSLVYNSGDTFIITWDGLGVTDTDARDERYPCQLYWAADRWPWEPLRSCPTYVDVELTYCDRHRP